MLDDVQPLIDELAESIPFRFASLAGSCLAWLAKQDQIERRKEGARLTYTQRDLIVVRSTLPRNPKDGDQFEIDNELWTVRPREDHCFTQSDRRGKLLRVYITK
jgi:hypothetical protein